MLTSSTGKSPLKEPRTYSNHIITVAAIQHFDIEQQLSAALSALQHTFHGERASNGAIRFCRVGGNHVGETVSTGRSGGDVSQIRWAQVDGEKCRTVFTM